MKEHQISIIEAFQSSPMNIMLTILMLTVGLALTIASTVNIIKKKKRNDRDTNGAYGVVMLGIGIMIMTFLFSGIYTFNHASKTNVSGKETVKVKETLTDNNGYKSWTFKSHNGHTYEVKSNTLRNENEPKVHAGDKVTININNAVIDKNRSMTMPNFDESNIEYQIIKEVK